MESPTKESVADEETLAKHVDAALENATDETARFHLRHAKQLVIDLRGGGEGAADAGEATENGA